MVEIATSINCELFTNENDGDLGGCGRRKRIQLALPT